MSKKKKVYKTSMIIRFVAFVTFYVFAWRYNIRKNMPKEVRKLKSPYLVLGNHVGLWDPFVTGTLLPKYTHFVASDAAFRSPFMGFFLRNLGAIPVKKNMRDTRVIRYIVEVIKKGKNVGIFPEAVRNWAGSSFPLEPSIAKLIKLLKVPVVVPLMRGMNLFNPRWSVKLRKSRVVIDYTLLFTAEQIKELTEEEIFNGLVEALQHDEVDYQRREMIKLHSRHKAEHISHALYLCPECRSIDTFRCSGNDFACRSCGYDIHIDDYGFFLRPGGGSLHFDNIRDWYYWQEKELVRIVKEKVESGAKDLIFEDKNSVIYYGEDIESEMVNKGNADVLLYTDKIILKFNDGHLEEMSFDDLLAINPQVRERLEITCKDRLYRIIGGRPGVSALKWEVASNAIWRVKGQLTKLSPYINSQ